MNHELKEAMLDSAYEYSLGDIAEKIFMHVNTASTLERKAIANFKIELAKRGYTLEDLL